MFDTPSQVRSSKPSSSIAGTERNVMVAAKGGGLIFFSNIFQNGIRFVSGVLLARFLGADQLGLYNLTLTGAEMATAVAVLGLHSALVRYVSLYAARRDESGLWGTLQVGLGISVLMSIVTGIGLYFLSDVIAIRLFEEPRLVPLLHLAAILVPFLAINDVIAAATRGFKTMQYTVLVEGMTMPLLRLVLIVVLVFVVGLTPAKAVAAYILTVMIGSMLFVHFLDKLFPLRRSVQEGRRNPQEMLGFALPVYLSNLISTFSGNIQALLLGTMNTIANVGIFAVATQVNMIGRLFHSAFVTTSMPLVSELHDQGKREQLRHLFQTVTKWTFTMNFPMFLVVVLFPETIMSIFGRGFADGATALTILAWANLVNVGTGIGGVVIDMTGNTKLRLMNSFMTVACTVGLNVVLIPRWGLIGAAVAALSGAIIINVLRLSEIFILLRLQPYNLSFLKPVVAGVVALIASWIVSRFFPPEASLIYVVMNAILLVAVYVGTLVSLGLSEEDRLVLARVSGRVTTLWSK